MKIRIEKWMGHEVRFVERASGDWWAIAVDVTKALGIRNTTTALLRIEDENKALHSTEGLNRGNEAVNIVSEFGIYDLIWNSRRKEAKEFKRWVFSVIKQLRQSSGLEAFQIFRMLDKEHQREMMSKLSRSLATPGRPDFIKANTIANKAISNKFGHPKMLKKEQMSPSMIVERQAILDDTVALMAMQDKFGLKLSISETVYSKYVH